MDPCRRRGGLQLGRTGPARCDRLSHERQQSSSAIARGRGGEQRVPVQEEPECAIPVSTTTGGAANTTACASALAHEDREDGSSSINPVNISTNRGCCGRSESGGHEGLVIVGKILAKGS